MPYYPPYNLTTTTPYHYEWPPNANGTLRLVAHRAMQLTTPIKVGTGTVTYEVALAASPTTWSTATFPLTMATGDLMRMTCSSNDSVGTLVAVPWVAL